MDAQSHYDRFKRTALQSAKIWGYSVDVGSFPSSDKISSFSVIGNGHGWNTSNSVQIFDHSDLAAHMSRQPVFKQVATGFYSAALVILQGGMAGYFRHAWRFGLFFLFPFVFMGIILAIYLTVIVLPWWMDLHASSYLWSLPLAWALFQFALLPFSKRFYTLHLFADWQMAVKIGRLNDPFLNRWIEACADTMTTAIERDADEYVISSHSMGSALAVQVLGLVLEKNPNALAGKRVVFVTLGGAILQSALLRPAKILRQRVGTIARSRQVTWLEVQSLTDVIHFYKSRVVALSGHPDAPQAEIITIRVKHLLTQERYRRVKRDLLRVHRQYVLHADKRGSFDFTLLTVGPFPSGLTSDYSKRDFNTVSASGRSCDVTGGPVVRTRSERCGFGG